MLNLLNFNLQAGQVDASVHTLAKYALELTLVEYNFAHIPPSKVAASALAVSLVVSQKFSYGKNEYKNKPYIFFKQ